MKKLKLTFLPQQINQTFSVRKKANDLEISRKSVTNNLKWTNFKVTITISTRHFMTEILIKESVANT